MEKTNFSKKYRIVNEVLNAVTHGIGFGLSIVGLVILLSKAIQLGSTLHVISYALYGTTLILLFLSSTLFHSLIFTRAKKVFQVFDHSAIFLLIAGSYTPFCLLSVKGLWGWILFGVIWLMAIVGIIYKACTLHKQQTVKHGSTVIYIIMGWLCVLAAHSLYLSLGFTGIMLLISGGVAYTLGAIFYSFPHIRFMHVVWHLFVMMGAAFMYFSVLFFT